MPEAEGEGFEPPVLAHFRFQDGRLQPLGHPSRSVKRNAAPLRLDAVRCAGGRPRQLAHHGEGDRLAHVVLPQEEHRQPIDPDP